MPWREIRNAQDQAQRDVVVTGRKVSSELERTVVDKLPKLIATALSGLASEAMKPGLKGAAVLARSMGDEMDALKAEDRGAGQGHQPVRVQAENQSERRTAAHLPIVLHAGPGDGCDSGPCWE